jgi:protein-L-isoaspartate(D-aspartate) O-methyltransferase
MAEVTTPIQDRSVERQRMVALQVARRGVTDQHVLEAMRQVPREAFVGDGMEEFAYEDNPLPIAAGQTISQPYIVALMIEAAQIKPSDRVLDVGTGSGYAAAVLSRLAAKVFGVDTGWRTAVNALWILRCIPSATYRAR